MKPQYRVIKINNKFFVEYLEKKATLLRKEVWRPCITWSGMDVIHPFTTIDAALRELELEVRRNACLNYEEL